MRRERLSLVLALALLVGQGLAAAHGPEHSLQTDAAHGCAACVFTDASGTGALPVVAVALQFATAEVPHAALALAAARLAPRHHPIRGPPILLA